MAPLIFFLNPNFTRQPPLQPFLANSTLTTLLVNSK